MCADTGKKASTFYIRCVTEKNRKFKLLQTLPTVEPIYWENKDKNKTKTKRKTIIDWKKKERDEKIDYTRCKD